MDSKKYAKVSAAFLDGWVIRMLLIIKALPVVGYTGCRIIASGYRIAVNREGSPGELGYCLGKEKSRQELERIAGLFYLYGQVRRRTNLSDG